MEQLEQSLKHKLEQELLLEPSSDCDAKIRALIEQSEISKKEKPFLNRAGYLWPIAASILLAIFYFVEQSPVDNELQLALNKSSSLEQRIEALKYDDVNPVIFMEINRLNSQIADLDLHLQSLLGVNNKQEEIIALVNQRIEKLNLVKELYSHNATAYRI